MQTFLARLPLPISGLMLGLASLGNIYHTVAWQGGWLLCQGLAMGLWLLVMAKFVVAPGSVKTALEDPVVTSVLPNLTMATMLICTCLQALGLPAQLVTGLWWVAVVGHLAIMVYFGWHHLLKAPKRLAMVMPSWFVTFVGIGVIAVTAPQFAPALGVPMVIASLMTYALVFPIVMVRLVKVPLPTPAKPLVTIVCAPASLCLAAYLSVVADPNPIVAGGLLLFSQALYLGTLIAIRHTLRLPFAPSIAAFTFPVAITATAITKYNAVLLPSRWPGALLMGAQWLEWGVVTLMVATVFGRYAAFLLRTAHACRQPVSDRH
ncbi:TDT family transporter [Lacticaseibacillus sp. GG6-2]